MGVKQRSKSLKSRQSELSDTLIQIDVLNKIFPEINIDSFEEKLAKHGYAGGIQATDLDIFQLNIGKLCNQTCAHCHVDAGPDRKEENMSRDTLEMCLEIIQKNRIKTVDITGGAPEMNPHFRWFVEACRKAGSEVIDRCNLTIIQANPKYKDLPQFFAKNQVQIVSSLPYFSKSRTDSQRGDGVFEDSIQSLKDLNEVGYGREGSGLILDLVYNPSGAFLPDDQVSLEAEFKRQLKRKYDIEFNQLYAITNLPVSRFLDYLIESGNYEQYMTALVDAFNPSTIPGLMCRNTVSVSWDGYVYDCDFNQMLELSPNGPSKHISDFDLQAFQSRKIVTNQHCFGCTAGAGSSCGGTVV